MRYLLEVRYLLQRDIYWRKVFITEGAFIGEVFIEDRNSFECSIYYSGGIYCRQAFIGVRYLLQTGIYWIEVFIADRHLLERYLLQTGIYWIEVFIADRHLLE